VQVDISHTEISAQVERSPTTSQVSETVSTTTTSLTTESISVSTSTATTTVPAPVQKPKIFGSKTASVPSTSNSSTSTSNPRSYGLLKSNSGVLNALHAKPPAWLVKRSAPAAAPKVEPTAQVVAKPPEEILVKNELEKYNKKFFTFEELTAKKKPLGVDVTVLEKYLTDEDFEKLFEMTKPAYYAIPSWKRVTLRKNKGLF